VLGGPKGCPSQPFNVQHKAPVAFWSMVPFAYTACAFWKIGTQAPDGFPEASAAPFGDRKSPPLGPNNIVPVPDTVKGPPGSDFPLPVKLVVINVQSGPKVGPGQPLPTGPKATKAPVAVETECLSTRSPSPAASAGPTNIAHRISANAALIPHRDKLALTGFIKTPSEVEQRRDKWHDRPAPVHCGSSRTRPDRLLLMRRAQIWVRAPQLALIDWRYVPRTKMVRVEDDGSGMLQDAGDSQSAERI